MAERIRRLPLAAGVAAPYSRTRNGWRRDDPDAHAYQWRGRELVDPHGDKVGTVEELYLDQQTDQPEWAAVRTGLFGTKLIFVPIQNAEPAGGKVRVPFDKSSGEGGPAIDPEGELSQQEEAALYEHYGMVYSELRSDSGLPEGGGRRDQRPDHR